jgi:hypothetical protein
MKDEIRSEVSSVYDKMQKEVSQSLKKYTDSINTLERQTKRFWAFAGVKEALFWSMSIAIILLIGRATLDVYGVRTPEIVWQVLYPCSFIPFVGYAISVIIAKINDN